MHASATDVGPYTIHCDHFATVNPSTALFPETCFRNRHEHVDFAGKLLKKTKKQKNKTKQTPPKQNKNRKNQNPKPNQKPATVCLSTRFGKGWTLQQGLRTWISGLLGRAGGL